MKRFIGLFLLVFVVMAITPQLALANTHGVFRVVKGDVQVKSGKNGKTQRAKIGQKVFPKDTIVTGKDSRAKIVMVDKNVINVSPDSNIVFEHYEYEPDKKKKNVLLNVIYGKVRSKVNQKYDGKNAKFQVKTKSAVAGVRGTDFLASFNNQTNQSQVVTFEGEVSFGQPGPGGTIQNPVAVGVGQMADQMPGAAPSPPKAVPKQMLAQMDSESNADKGGAPAAGDKREPAGNDKKDDGKSKKEGSDDKGSQSESGKKDGDGKSAKSEGNKSEGSKSSGSKSEGSKSSNSKNGDSKSSGNSGNSAGKSGGKSSNSGNGTAGSKAGSSGAKGGVAASGSGSSDGSAQRSPASSGGTSGTAPNMGGNTDGATAGPVNAGGDMGGGLSPEMPPMDDMPDVGDVMDIDSMLPTIDTIEPVVIDCQECTDAVQNQNINVLIQIGTTQ